MPGWRRILAWLVVAPWAAWALVRVLGREGGFPGVQLMAFTPYVVPLALAGGVAAALLRRRAPVAVAVVTLLALGAVVVPRATGSPTAQRGPALRVLSVNLHYGRVVPAEVVALVESERVDVLAVQELSPWAAQGLADAGIGRELPHHVLRARANAAGTGLYARRPLRRVRAPGGTTDAYSAASLPVPGAAPVTVLAVHPAAPIGQSATARWRRDLRALPSPPAGATQLLVGDFNATLDHRELRGVLGRGYRDAADVVGSGLAPTWRGTRTPPVTIDHVLLSGAAGVRVHALPGGDHRGLFAELRLPRR